MKRCVPQAAPKLWLCAALALLVCFFSVAVYTPLHVHKNGDPKQCSLNNVEHQVADSVVPTLDLPKPSPDVVASWVALAISIPSAPDRQVAARGPPPVTGFLHLQSTTV
jgi:hypothetical protein